MTTAAIEQMPPALRILAAQIQAPDHIPAMCLRDAATMIETLTDAIHETLMENLHLADGEVCTLKRLKDAIGFQLPPEKDPV